MSTDQAQAQVNPGVPRLNAFFTDVLACLPELDLIKMTAFFLHKLLHLQITERPVPIALVETMGSSDLRYDRDVHNHRYCRLLHAK